MRNGIVNTDGWFVWGIGLFYIIFIFCMMFYVEGSMEVAERGRLEEVSNLEYLIDMEGYACYVDGVLLHSVESGNLEYMQRNYVYVVDAADKKIIFSASGKRQNGGGSFVPVILP